MNDKPEALLIAELLEKDGLNPALTIRMDAAAELRRLHEENERLRAKCDELGSDRETWYRMAELHCATIDRLKTSMREAVAAEREKVAAWKRARSYATGHGDTTEDLLKELEWQVAEREREACAKLCEEKASRIEREIANGDYDTDTWACAINCASAIRARGET